MYWSDVGTDRIERATMDGRSRTVLHSTGLSNVYGITLDYDKQILYWVDYSYGRIESSSVDGSNRQVILASISSPWAVTFHEGTLYWTSTSYDRIYSYTNDSSPASIIEVTPSLGANPYDIRVISEDRQPLGMFQIMHTSIAQIECGCAN